MKKYARKIAVGLLAVMLFSALTGYAFAANTDHKEFGKNMYPGSYSMIDKQMKKTNATDMFIQIDTTSVGTSYSVRALGCNESGLQQENYTVYNNMLVDHVVCVEGSLYGVDTLVYERGDGYGAFSVMQGTAYGMVSGWWSPDTAQSYAAPSAP